MGFFSGTYSPEENTEEFVRYSSQRVPWLISQSGRGAMGRAWVFQAIGPVFDYGGVRKSRF